MILRGRGLDGWSLSARIGLHTGLREITGCRIWAGEIGKDGYPRLKFRGAVWRVSRAILGLSRGDARVAMHSCDNPRCVEPAHLRAGTHSDNVMDSVQKGRHRQVRKTHCPRGHAYSESNVRRWAARPMRRCRACERVE
jgi:hypothetical protein